MQVLQGVDDQSFQGAAIAETGWAEDEDPEHSLEQSFEDQGPPGADEFLDSAEFRKELEDRNFHADLKWACKFTFNRFSQSTHWTWEDLQQEVLIRFGAWLRRYKKEAKRRTVLVRIATNLMIDAARSEKTNRRQHQRVSFDDLALESMLGEPGDDIESRIFLKECLRKLSPKELVVFEAHAVNGESLRQLASNHGVSPAAMSKRWARIITKLPHAK